MIIDNKVSDKTQAKLRYIELKLAETLLKLHESGLKEVDFIPEPYIATTLEFDLGKFIKVLKSIIPIRLKRKLLKTNLISRVVSTRVVQFKIKL